MNEMLDAALAYVEAGFGVIPLRPRAKTPMTKHGLKDWTDDPESVRTVWGRYPDANIGLVCGTASGNLVVIDVDRDDDAGYDGAESLDEWEREHGKLPETACEVTGRGGVHYFYRTDGRDLHPDSSPELHIDVRGGESYVMAAPSVHPNGNAMYWDLDYRDYPIADADENVYALIERIYQHGGRDAARPKVDASEGFKKGRRNNTLYKMACGLMAQSWDDDAIIASIETYNAHAKDPLPKHEVGKLLKSALSLPKGKSDEWYKERVEGPGKGGDATPKRGRSRRFDHAAMGDRLIDECGACFIDGMPAVRDGDVYKIGWRAVDAEIIKIQKDATKANQAETHHYLNVMAPRREQSRPTLIGFTNGVLDVDTMELLPYSDDMVIPNVIPHAWNVSARSEAVDTVLRNISLDDLGLQMNLAEVMGLVMFRSCKYPVCPVLLGDGANGKSTYIDMLMALVGEENASALQPREIGMRFQAGQLVGKLANLGDDISNDYIDGDACSSIKKIATGNVMYTDVKGGEGFNFRPYCTMVFCANKFPRLGDSSYGMMRRLFPMGFKADFKAGDRDDFDASIGDKVTTEEACEYMCLIGVEGLRRVIAQNGMTKNDESETIVHDVEVDNNTVLQWIEQNDLQAEDVIGRTGNSVHEEYSKWCQEHAVKAVGPRNFNGTLLAQWHISLCAMEHFMVKGVRKTKRVYGYAR